MNNPRDYSGICHISVAANLDPEHNIPRGLDLLHSACPIQKISSFRRTQAIGRPEQPDYLNGAVAVYYTGDIYALKLRTLRGIETELGRVRGPDKYAARTLDLDILACDSLVVHTPELTLPDPDIYTRPFLAAALLELAPELILPDTGRPLRTLESAQGIDNANIDAAFTRTIKERFAHEY